MNSDKVVGTARNLAGNARSAVGDMVGDAKSQIQGRAQAGAGRVQEAAGDLGEQISSNPLAAVLIAGAVGFLVGRLSGR